MLLNTWEYLLANADLKGKDMEFRGIGGAVYRGPIAEIKKEDSQLIIKHDWLAELHGSKGWRRADHNEFSANILFSSPRVMEDGTILFRIPHIGTAVILPLGNHLDFREVH